MKEHLRPRELIGSPVFVSPRATWSLFGVRRWLSRLHGAMAPPILTVNEAVAGLYDNRVLGFIVEHGVADLLDRPRSAREVAEAVGGDPDAVERILRYAASRRFVSHRRNGLYASSPVTRILRSDRTMSWAPLVARATSAEHWDAWRDLDLAAGLPATTAAPPRATNTEIDAIGTTVQAVALARDLVWHDVRHVCDVGGGNGAAAEVLLTTVPDLHAIVLDRPEVIAEARPALRPGGRLAERTTLVAGDFFVSVPPGADRYLLVAVLTACDDHDAVRVLERIRDAMSPDARLLIVDHILSEQPTEELAQVTDLLLLVHGAGRERTREQYTALAARAGFDLKATHRLSTGCMALELAPGP